MPEAFLLLLQTSKCHLIRLPFGQPPSPQGEGCGHALPLQRRRHPLLRTAAHENRTLFASFFHSSPNRRVSILPSVPMKVFSKIPRSCASNSSGSGVAGLKCVSHRARAFASLAMAAASCIIM